PAVAPATPLQHRVRHAVPVHRPVGGAGADDGAGRRRWQDEGIDFRFRTVAGYEMIPRFASLLLAGIVALATAATFAESAGGPARPMRGGYCGRCMGARPSSKKTTGPKP